MFKKINLILMLTDVKFFSDVFMFVFDIISGRKIFLTQHIFILTYYI